MDDIELGAELTYESLLELDEMLVSVSSDDPLIRRQKIIELENTLKQYEQIEIPVKHYFCGGMYAREIVIPKGAIITGAIQKFDHFDVMLSGRMTVSTDCGEIKQLKGYNLLEGKAGKKRAGYAHEETHWVTFHNVPSRPADEMKSFITCSSFEEYDLFKENHSKALGYIKDREDYDLFLKQVGVSESFVRMQSDNTKDQMPLPESIADNFLVQHSGIEGLGVFVVRDIKKGDVIGPARIGGKRTPLCRYVNHSPNPNGIFRFSNETGDIELVATKDIKGVESGMMDELLVNYRNSLRFAGVYIGGDK